MSPKANNTPLETLKLQKGSTPLQSCTSYGLEREIGELLVFAASKGFGLNPYFARSHGTWLDQHFE